MAEAGVKNINISNQKKQQSHKISSKFKLLKSCPVTHGSIFYRNMGLALVKT